MLVVGETEMLEAVEPVFHAYVVAPAAETVVELPLQMVNEGEAERVKVGIGFTVTVTVDVLEHPEEVPVTV